MTEEARLALILIMESRDKPDSDWSWDDDNYRSPGTMKELMELGFVEHSPKGDAFSRPEHWWQLTEKGKKGFLLLR